MSLEVLDLGAQHNHRRPRLPLIAALLKCLPSCLATRALSRGQVSHTETLTALHLAQKLVRWAGCPPPPARGLPGVYLKTLERLAGSLGAHATWLSPAPGGSGERERTY